MMILNGVRRGDAEKKKGTKITLSDLLLILCLEKLDYVWRELVFIGENWFLIEDFSPLIGKLRTTVENLGRNGKLYQFGDLRRKERLLLLY